METENIEPILDDGSIETIEVMFGLQPDAERSKLEAYLGEDGRILDNSGFDLYKVRLTTECLEGLTELRPGWIEFIEHPGPGVPPFYDTKNNEI